MRSRTYPVLHAKELHKLQHTRRNVIELPSKQLLPHQKHAPIAAVRRRKRGQGNAQQCKHNSIPHACVRGAFGTHDGRDLCNSLEGQILGGYGTKARSKEHEFDSQRHALKTTISTENASAMATQNIATLCSVMDSI